MKTIKKLLLLTLSAFSLSTFAQTDEATTARIVNDKNFIFVATNAIPLNATDISRVLNQMSGPPTGGTINLTGSNYDLRIAADSIVSYLPFYGRAFMATPYGGNNNDSGFRFTSKKFTYKNTPGRKKGWDIAIQTKDVKDNVRMNLSVTENGYATLSVVSNNKQSITYNGYLQEVEKEKPSK